MVEINSLELFTVIPLAIITLFFGIYPRPYLDLIRATMDQIIEKIETIQQTISMEKVVIHMMYGGMPRDKAEKSLRLFAEKVLPEVQSMPTPINPKSLGEPVF